MVLYSDNDLISEFFYQTVFLFPPHNLYLFHQEVASLNKACVTFFWVKRFVLKYFELIFRHFCPCLNFIVSGECRKGFNLLITLFLEFLLIF